MHGGRGAEVVETRFRENGLVHRNGFYAGLFLLATLNSFAGQAIRTVQEQGWFAAFSNLLGISAILWAGLIAGLKILAEKPATGVRHGDRWLAVGVTVLALMPPATASMFALTVLSLSTIFTSTPGSQLRRAGFIFLAMAGALIWGRLVLATFSRPLLDVDAFFVSSVIGAHHQGNMIWFNGAPTRLVVAPGCSSMQGLSLALLFSMMINQLFKVRLSWTAVVTCVAALAATVGINVLRIGAMLRYPDHLEAIHTGWGYHLSMWITLVTVAGICLFGARDAIFRR